MTWLSRLYEWFAERAVFLTSPWRAEIHKDELNLHVLRRIEHLERIMADVSPLLNKLADDLRTWSAGPFAAVLAENAALRSERDTAVADAASARGEAEVLRSEDAAETSAADNAVSAFNELVAPVSESPDVPVEIPAVEVPAESPPADDAPAAV